MENWTRRKFFQTTLAATLAASSRKLFGALGPNRVAAQGAPKATRPVIISSANGLNALDRGMEVLRKGGDTLTTKPPSTP